MFLKCHSSNCYRSHRFLGIHKNSPIIHFIHEKIEKISYSGIIPSFYHVFRYIMTTFCHSFPQLVVLPSQAIRAKKTIISHYTLVCELVSQDSHTTWLQVWSLLKKKLLLSSDNLSSQALGVPLLLQLIPD